MEASIEIEVDNQPDTFSLSGELCQVLGMKQGTRAAVMHTLWAYIKAHRLQVLLCFCILALTHPLTDTWKALSLSTSLSSSTCRLQVCLASACSVSLTELPTDDGMVTVNIKSPPSGLPCLCTLGLTQ